MIRKETSLVDPAGEGVEKVASLFELMIGVAKVFWEFGIIGIIGDGFKPVKERNF